jgi:SAM-dependent methyltransferase
VTPPREATERFSALVEDYDRYRPGYPKALFDFLTAHAGLDTVAEVADIGAGTGIFTRSLLKLGCTVFAVEPNAPMRQIAEANLVAYPRFHSSPGNAESTSLPNASVDWVFAAQAFHWFDRPKAQREFARILRPRGSVALVFNERLTDASPFLRAYEDALLKHSIDYQQINHANLKPEVFNAFFNAYEYANFPNEQRVDLDGLLGRVRSCSYVPHPGDSGWPALEQEMTHIFQTFQDQGKVSILYQTQLYWGTLPNDDGMLSL